MKNITSITLLDEDSSALLYNQTVIKHSNFSGQLSSFSTNEVFLNHSSNGHLDQTCLFIIDLMTENLSAFQLLDTLRKTYPFPSYRVIILGIMIPEEVIEKSTKYDEIVRVIEKPLSIPVLNDLLSLNLAAA